MTHSQPTQAMIDLYDRFTHGHGIDRRTLMAEMARLAGGAAAAGSMLGLIAARADAAPLVAPDDRRVSAGEVVADLGGGRTMRGYLARSVKDPGKAARVLLVHENRGLNEHNRDLARRLAVAGFMVFAADFLTPLGGTPTEGDGTNSAEDVARTMIGKLDRAQTVADGVATLKWLIEAAPGVGVPAAVGFCWGGGMVNALAVEAGPMLRAGVAYYGAAPQDVAGASRVKARLLLHYAGLDERVNAMAPAWQAALQAAGTKFEAHTYEGANHGFNNDTAAARYDQAAAELAWGRTLAWLKR
ncbi:dienelactone hydrolase family protein [Sandarakinorhabdus sp.]|uniref:dienelactone hydrolase family protein n=1 Tax=Sandarakinorhabdus sp. TaxID=1916663 RepID=UPI003F708C7E